MDRRENGNCWKNHFYLALAIVGIVSGIIGTAWGVTNSQYDGVELRLRQVEQALIRLDTTLANMDRLVLKFDTELTESARSRATILKLLDELKREIEAQKARDRAAGN